jgi:hypothetical protein
MLSILSLYALEEKGPASVDVSSLLRRAELYSLINPEPFLGKAQDIIKKSSAFPNIKITPYGKLSSWINIRIEIWGAPGQEYYEERFTMKDTPQMEEEGDA